MSLFSLAACRFFFRPAPGGRVRPAIVPWSDGFKSARGFDPGRLWLPETWIPRAARFCYTGKPGNFLMCFARGLAITRGVHRERAKRSPSSTDVSEAGGTLPTRSVRNALSMVITCETLTTEGFARPVPLTGSRTFPGASARRRFEVMTAAMTVLIRLSLKLLAETMRYGLRYPGPEPEGSGNDAHQTSPRRTTTSRGGASDSGARRRRDRARTLHHQPRKSR